MERRDTFFLPGKNKKQEKNTKQEYKKKRHEEFNKNRFNKEKQKEDKKPFDKKNYRLKKYSKKYKLDQWEEQRKKKLLRNYYKDVKNDEVNGSYKPISFDDDNDAVDSNQNVGKYVRHPDVLEKEKEVPIKKKDPFQKAKEQYNKINQEKLQKKQEVEKAKEERNQKSLEYKKKKQDKFKKLSKKNKKGQPVMSGRLELLLDKIQKSK